MVDAEVVVRDLINKILAERKLKKKNVEIERICTEGSNYTTSLYTIKVDAEDDNLDLFAKVAIIVGEIRKQLNADWLYKTERFVYLELVKTYEALQIKYDVPVEHRFVFPICYGINHEEGQETVVLENLWAKSYKSYNRFKSMDWEHAAISVELLAKFHALSFAYEKENPEEFKELATTMVRKMGAGSENREQTIPVWIKIVDRALDVIDVEYRDKIRDLMMQRDVFKQYNKPNPRAVLCHGDYRLSNILFRGEGESLEAICVDYQTVNSGCPSGDLIYFVFMGSDEEFRRQYFDRLMDHYYDNLCHALRRFDIDNVDVYPRETFDENIKKNLPYALFLGVAVLPVVTVEPESVPKLDEEADISSFIVEPNALYASRLRGIVNDCVRWGVI